MRPAPVVTKMRARRVVSGLRLYDVARATKICESRISLIERLESSPSDRERERLSAYYEAPIESLLDEAHPETP